ncbi:MAG: Lrp/AsnC family transcriptional regulator [bacterium]|nr:Lrp/AsnC family transcriptional regulator [bacterium]
MNEKDIEIIRALQNEEVYLTLDPFGEIARDLGMDKSKLLEAVNDLKERGAIRRFGAAITPHKAGFTSNAMVAWEVDEDMEEAAAGIMAAHPRVSHCYLRPPFEDFPYTLYTMTHANSPEDLDEILEEMSEKTGVKKRRVLKSVKEFKKSSPVYFP